jgi:hypothetical protein
MLFDAVSSEGRPKVVTIASLNALRGTGDAMMTKPRLFTEAK